MGRISVPQNFLGSLSGDQALCRDTGETMAGLEVPLTTKLAGAAEAVVKRRVQVRSSQRGAVRRGLTACSAPAVSSGDRLACACDRPARVCARDGRWHANRPGRGWSGAACDLRRPHSLSVRRRRSSTTSRLRQTRCCATMCSSWWATRRHRARSPSTSRCASALRCTSGARTLPASGEGPLPRVGHARECASTHACRHI